MSKSKVYYTNARALHYRYIYSLPAKLEKLLDVAGFENYIPANKKVAVKTHFGTSGAFRITRPRFLGSIVRKIIQAEGQPFVTDTGGMGKLESARLNGITELSVGAPVILAGGIKDMEGVVIKTGGDMIQEIAVAGAIYDSDAMVVVSHGKGHIQPGFGAAIKNVAMGCVISKTRDGEIQRGKMHSTGEAPFDWDESKCILCGQCAEICSKVANALKIENEKVHFDSDKCFHCGRCARVCPTGAMSTNIDEVSFAKGLAEATNAVISTFEAQRVLYVTFVMEFIPECDCMPMADTPFIQDQGILISDDPVAIDAAMLELVGKAKPLPQSRAEEAGVTEAREDLIQAVLKRDPWNTVKEAEKMGLGNSLYDLIQIEPQQ